MQKWRKVVLLGLVASFGLGGLAASFVSPGAPAPSRQEARQEVEPLTPREVVARSDSALVYGSGDRTVVEFFDYNCSHCRNSYAYTVPAPDGVRLVMMHLPILGSGSMIAAAAVVAAERQGVGMSLKLHEELKKVEGSIGKDEVANAAESAGLDVDRLMADAQGEDVLAELIESAKLATSVGIQGTPSFVTEEGAHPGGFAGREGFEKWVFGR